MDISYPYTKQRKDFGKQPMFCEVPVHLLDSIDSNILEQRKYCLRNPVQQQSQASNVQSEHYINTRRVVYQDTGVNHSEGGWPKEIPFYDEELTARHRKRVEREDCYIDAVMNTYPKLERYIKQNNAIEMYDMFYKEMPCTEPVEKYSLRSSAYVDPSKRPISCLSWTLEDDPKLVVAYCNKQFPVTGPVNKNLTCFVWDLENPYAPSMEFLPPSACWQIICSPVNPEILIGGLENGRVCLFDLRAQKKSVMMSPAHLAHRDPVSSLLYVQSRQNTEFFSGSTDGRCMWWDVRNISDTIDLLVMSARLPPGEQVNLSNAEGVSALQFERSIPTRFLCGTDTGLVINVNRKGKTHNETMSAVFYAHQGPVQAVHRSPCTTKMFITCGDWTVHIWSDDVLSSPIVSGTPHKHKITDVVWAPQRVSCYMSVCADGKFRYWDLLRKYREPVILLQVSKDPLLKIKPHDEGRLIAIGDAKGVMHIVSLSENLVESASKDKQLMMQTYDRETRREHILENRIKEIRLKKKAEEEAVPIPVENMDEEEAIIKAAEADYRNVVYEEMRKPGGASDRYKPGTMRQR